MSAHDSPDGLHKLNIYFTDPNGNIINLAGAGCQWYGGPGWNTEVNCSSEWSFGLSSLEPLGTYTYAYMSAEDRSGNQTGNIHHDNPFNVPDFTVLDIETPPNITGGSAGTYLGDPANLGDELYINAVGHDSQKMRDIYIYFNDPDGNVIKFGCVFYGPFAVWGHCSKTTTFGSGSLETVGTYTYAYMSATDVPGSATGPTHHDNPFNIQDFVYTGMTTPPTITGASVKTNYPYSNTSGGLGDSIIISLSAEDSNGVDDVSIFFTNPNGDLIVMSCNMGGDVNDTCSPYKKKFGTGFLETVGTYTYAHMSATDRGGSETGPIHQDNPFNVPDLTYTGETTPPIFTKAHFYDTTSGEHIISGLSGEPGDQIYMHLAAEDDHGRGYLYVYFNDPNGNVIEMHCGDGYQLFYPDPGHDFGCNPQGYYFGQGVLATPGSYTYAYMVGTDSFGSSSGPIHHDNPFNVSDFVVLVP